MVIWCVNRMSFCVRPSSTSILANTLTMPSDWAVIACFWSCGGGRDAFSQPCTGAIIKKRQSKPAETIEALFMHVLYSLQASLRVNQASSQPPEQPRPASSRPRSKTPCAFPTLHFDLQIHNTTRSGITHSVVASSRSLRVDRKKLEPRLLACASYP